MISQFLPSLRFSLHDHRVESEPSRVFAATQPSGGQPDSEVLSSNAFALTAIVVLSPASTNPPTGVGAGGIVVGAGVGDVAGGWTKRDRARTRRDLRQVSCKINTNQGVRSGNIPPRPATLQNGARGGFFHKDVGHTCITMELFLGDANSSIGHHMKRVPPKHLLKEEAHVNL